MTRRVLRDAHIWTDIKATEPITYPHYLVPENNLHTGVTNYCYENDWYRDPFPYNSTYHLPFLPPNILESLDLTEGDPIFSLVMKKLNWKAQLDSLQKYCHNRDLNFELVEEAVAKKFHRVKIRSYEGFLLHHLNEDPDPSFSGITNWWYTGGRLSHAVIGNSVVLLTSGGERNEKLYVVPLSDESKGWQPVTEDAQEFLGNSTEPIYQITTTDKKPGHCNLIGVRQRHTCSIIALKKGNDSIELSNRRSCEVSCSDNAFTSLDLNPYKYGKFCTSGIDRLVSIWDAKTSSCVSSHIVDKVDDKLSSDWSSLQYIDANTLIMADNSTLMVLDVRQAYDKPSLTYNPHNQPSLLSRCEDISLIIRSSDESALGRYIYCTTSHHVILFDIRGTQAVQRWTHMMPTPPIYGHTLPMGESNTKELLCIANQQPNEVQFIVNNWYEQNSVPRSAVFPYTIPKLVKSRHVAQMCGQLLDPRIDFRMQSSIAGVTCLPASATATHTVLTQTSLGDVFVQELQQSDRKTAYSKSDLRRLRVWEEQVLKIRTEPALKLSGKFSNESLINIVNDETLIWPRYSKKIKLPQSLKVSNAELLKYKDVLASKLLEAWDIHPPEPENSESVMDGNDIVSHESEAPVCIVLDDNENTQDIMASQNTPNTSRRRNANNSNLQDENAVIIPNSQGFKRKRESDRLNVPGF